MYIEKIIKKQQHPPQNNKKHDSKLVGLLVGVFWYIKAATYGVISGHLTKRGFTTSALIQSPYFTPPTDRAVTND